jgi:crotonobetainyl-CoA:carnitine CoA-transferase CaiB-like acyl-CoA transferase
MTLNPKDALDQGVQNTTGAPLAGVKVLALEQFQALPFCTNILARLGAEVVKVELPPAGEMARISRPGLTGPDGSYYGGTFLRNNHNKKSLAVDWKRPAGAKLLRRILANFDVFAENFRAGALDKHGLSYEALREVDPRIIYLSVSGFGHDENSPYYEWAAFASVVHAMAGLYPPGPSEDDIPKIGGTGTLGDSVAGLYAAIGILAALRARDGTGYGQNIDISMLDCMVAIQDFAISQWVLREEASTAIGIVDAFRCADGFFVLVVNRPHQFQKLASLIGKEAWLDDPALKTAMGWEANLTTVIRPAVEAWSRSRTRLAACRELAAAGIAAGPSLTISELVADEHLRLRSMIHQSALVGSTGQPYIYPGNPLKLSGMAERADVSPPRLGGDNTAILKSCGVSGTEIESLRVQGIIGPYANPASA